MWAIFCGRYFGILWYFVLRGVLHFCGNTVSHLAVFCVLWYIPYIMCSVVFCAFCGISRYVKLWYIAFGHRLRAIHIIRDSGRPALFVYVCARNAPWSASVRKLSPNIGGCAYTPQTFQCSVGSLRCLSAHVELVWRGEGVLATSLRTMSSALSAVCFCFTQVGKHTKASVAIIRVSTFSFTYIAIIDVGVLNPCRTYTCGTGFFILRQISPRIAPA